MKSETIFAEHFIPIGKLIGTKGLRGGLKFKLYESDYPFLSNDFIFIDINGLPVPWRVNVEQSSDELLFLDKLDTIEKAKRYVGSELLDLKSSYEEKGPDIPFQDLLNYQILVDGEPKGIITEINQYPSQIIATVLDSFEEEKLVPLVDQWILKIDRDQKRIVMDLPLGLL